MRKDVMSRLVSGKLPRTVAWTIVLLLATPLAAGFDKDMGVRTSNPQKFVGGGTTQRMDVPEDLDKLHVEGTLILDLPVGETLQALSVYVGPHGIIRGGAGVNGADALGQDATGSPGTDGGSVSIITSALVIEKGGLIMGGPGGRGGNAEGYGIVVGGHGGQGGSAIIQATSSHIEGLILPGAGGAGGHALQLLDGTIPARPDARAVGGDGGNSGDARMNDHPARIDPQDVRDSPNSVEAPFWATSAWPSYFSCGAANQASAGDPADVTSGISGVPNVPLFITAGDGGSACMISIQPDGTTPSGTGCNAGNADASAARATAVGGKGGDGTLIGAPGRRGGHAWAAAKSSAGGNAQPDCNSGSAAGGGAPGADATASATGGEGGHGGDSPVAVLGAIGGDGGAGGDAYAAARGGKGGDGGSNAGVGAGGGGGSGGVATADAKGGPGGAGGRSHSHGGHGGDAFGYGASGTGGKGGNGSTQGGDGGDAGSLTSITSRGGEGGAAPNPGDGGSALTSVDPEGGDGGAPNGLGGHGGDWNILAFGGNAGRSLGEGSASGGDATNEVPNGTGSGGVGGNGDPNHNKGPGVELTNRATRGLDSTPLATCTEAQCLCLTLQCGICVDPSCLPECTDPIECFPLCDDPNDPDCVPCANLSCLDCSQIECYLPCFDSNDPNCFPCVDPLCQVCLACHTTAAPATTPMSPLICGDVGYSSDPPSNGAHVYWTSNGILTFAQDPCPASGTQYSGELGFGFGGVWLFSRTGAGPNGGSGTEVCYGDPADAHHGADTTIHVKDDVLGGAVGFTVTRDYNRSTGNTGFTGLGGYAGPGNSLPDTGGTADCGDGMIEPCPDGAVDDDNATEAVANPNDPAGGCNSLDALWTVFPADGLCSGWQSSGEDNSLGTINPTDSAFPGRVQNFVLATVGIFVGVILDTTGLEHAPTPIGSIARTIRNAANPDGEETAFDCSTPAENTWTAPTTLGDFAGADGAVVVFKFSNVRIDADHMGTGTTGTIWTS